MSDRMTTSRANRTAEHADVPPRSEEPTRDGREQLAAWTVEQAAAYLGARDPRGAWSVAEVRSHVGREHRDRYRPGRLIPAPGEPPHRPWKVQHVTRSSVVRYARLFADDGTMRCDESP